MNEATSCFTTLICAGIVALSFSDVLAEPAGSVLQLEAKIPLGNVTGRIDHMAADLVRHRLFVAELGNDTIGVVDFDAKKVVHRIVGLKEPQGVAYIQMNDRFTSLMPETGRCKCSGALIIHRRDGSILARTPTIFASIQRPANFLSATARAASG